MVGGTIGVDAMFAHYATYELTALLQHWLHESILEAPEFGFKLRGNGKPKLSEAVQRLRSMHRPNSRRGESLRLQGVATGQAQ